MDFPEDIVNNMKQEENLEKPKLEKKERKKGKNILVIVVGLIAIIGLVAAGYSTYEMVSMKKTFDGAELVCQVKKCIEYETADEWIYRNCYVRDGDDTTCDLTIEGYPIEDVPRPQKIGEDVLGCKQKVCLLSTVYKPENIEFWEEEFLNNYNQMKKGREI